MNRAFSTLVLAAATLAAGAVSAAPSTYVIDPTHTFVTFEAKHFGTSTNRGRFDKKSGQVTLDRAAKKGSVDITIDMASINTGTAAFDGHLKSKDFFQVETHPSARFVGDKFTFKGDKLTSVAGTLTMLGQSQPVTLTLADFNCYNNPRLDNREVCGGDAETTIKRSAFGMNYGLPFIPDDIKLVIQVEAIKQ
ncbi:MAG: YceI family protein [Aquabacterium sp.]